MFLEQLGAARNGAIILLAIESLVLSLVPLLILYYVTRWLRGFIPRVAPGMQRAHLGLLGLQRGVDRVMAAIVAPFLWLESTGKALRRFQAQVSARFPGGNR